MPVYKDKRYKRWRYQTRVLLPSGKRARITGTPATNTKAAAEHAERLHVLRVTAPGLLPSPVESEPKAEIPTIKEFSERFMAEYKARQSNGERINKLSNLTDLMPAFGHLRLDAVTQSDVNKYIAATTVSGKTLNNRLATLSTLLSYAGPEGCRLIPAQSLRMNVRVSSPEIHAVPIADVARLLSAATDPRYRVAIALAAEAGLRVGEVRGAQWADIVDNRITIRRAIDPRNKEGPPKHGRIRRVPLSPGIVAALADLPHPRGPWIICSRSGNALDYTVALDGLKAIYELANVPVPKSAAGQTRPWHSLRHTFGSEMAKKVPLPVLQRLMGHAQIQVTMRYIQIDEEQMDLAIADVFGPAGQQVANVSN